MKLQRETFKDAGIDATNLKHIYIFGYCGPTAVETLLKFPGENVKNRSRCASVWWWMMCALVTHQGRQWGINTFEKENTPGGSLILEKSNLKTIIITSTDKGNRLTCPNHGRLAHNERHGYQGEGWEVHAPRSPFLPKGTISNIHSLAVVSRPGWAVNVG